MLPVLNIFIKNLLMTKSRACFVAPAIIVFICPCHEVQPHAAGGLYYANFMLRWKKENVCRSRRGRRRRWQQPLIVSTADLHSRTGFPFRRLSVD